MAGKVNMYATAGVKHDCHTMKSVTIARTTLSYSLQNLKKIQSLKPDSRTKELNIFWNAKDAFFF
jgi:hypothetical protein